jgi:predicted amidohydrolase YtcJ
MMRKSLLIGLALISLCVQSQAQQNAAAAKLGYPQQILYNGKIVTMDDEGFESSVGTIAQAMAVRDGKVLATGTTAEIRALAGPNTQSIDLKGRMVLPSFIMTHEHPTDWAFIEPRGFRHVFPDDSEIVSRWMPNVPAKEQFIQFESVIREAVSKAKPGQWIRVTFNWGPEYEWAMDMEEEFGRQITKQRLNDLAPRNPVIVKDGFIDGRVNTLAVEEFRKVHPDINFYETGRRGGVRNEERGNVAEMTGNLGRPLEPDAMFMGKTDKLAQVLKAQMELWASYGITTFGSSPYAPHNLIALNYLDSRGEMPGRFAYAYTGPSWDMETLRVISGMQGHGTDYLWLVGAWSGSGSGCMSVPEIPNWRGTAGEGGRSGGDNCTFRPGTVAREILDRIIESGLRVATMHTGGDKDIDYFMDSVEQASKKAGFTLEQIRAKRHAFDHGAGAPRPEQIPRMKNFGILASQINTILWETHRGASMIAKQYGVEYASWVVPRKRLTEAGIQTGFEIDRPLPHKVFFFITKGMNRLNDRDGKVYGPDQRTDRIVQLKALTNWGAYYLMKEKTMGTLEAGKLADYIVLDKDFLTVAEAEIPNLQVLMTVVGGKTVHLTPALAAEFGMTAVGPSTWKEPIPAGWQ